MFKKYIFASLLALCQSAFFVGVGFCQEVQTETGSLMDLERIVVTASKLEQLYKFSTQNISIINAKDLESTGVIEIAEVLDLLPAVDILEYGTIGQIRSVRARGASSSQTVTLIDGRPINTARDGVADFNQISLSNIERIEVLRGPASNIYGANAVGGVINIITKAGKKDTGTSLMTKLGSFNTKWSSLTHGDKINDFDYFVAYDYLASHGHRDNSDYISNNINTKLGYQFNDDNRIAVSSGYYNSELGTPGQLNNIDLDDRQESFKKYIDLNYYGKFCEGQDILLKIYQNTDRFEFIEAFDPMDKAAHQTKLYGAQAQISQTFFERFRTAIGGSFEENRLNSSNSGKHTFNVKGAYFESETDFINQGSLKFGARWDDYSNFGDRISPSASFNFWLFDKIKIHGLAAKSFRAPTFNDLYWPREDWGIFGGVEGNTGLTPEKAVSYEGGISTYLFGKFKTDITLFKTKFDDLIEWTVDSSWWWRPENLSCATIQGLEIESELIDKEHLKVNLNYTYLESKDRHTKKWLIYRPRHMYKLKVLYSPVPKLEIGLNAIYKTKRFTNADNTSLLKHFAILNLNSSFRVNEYIKILFEVKNVFDRAYQEQREYSMPGRAFYGGLKINF
ncbi:TonB-dependent receptor plug domain-containing protein [Candidatus Omnitrophota bacterium]